MEEDGEERSSEGIPLMNSSDTVEFNGTDINNEWHCVIAHYLLDLPVGRDPVICTSRS